MNSRTYVRRLAFIVLIAVAGAGSTIRAEEDTASVRLMVGRSTIVNTEKPIARISLTSSDIADAMVTEPNQLLIQGKVPGTISMFVWDRGGTMRRYDVTVERDLSPLAQQMRDLFPGEALNVVGNGKAVVVSGTATSKYVADKAVEVAAGHVEKKEDVVNLVQVREGPPPQVLLKVRFAEVSRSALTELGASLFTGPNGSNDWLGRTTTQQFPAPYFDSSGQANKLVFSDFLNLFLFDLKNDLGVLIKALQNKGLFQSLAEPNLVAETGKEASFLAGGEFPIPIAQAGAANMSITVEFKEFGVRLNFTPTVIGSRVRLKVRPEVSTLDFSNAIVLQGFRIPALSTRRTETELELQDGQTFAIAGLLNSTATEQLQKIPGIGDIPILGYLFKSKAAQKQRTELVVMITPQILPMNSPGVTPDLPRLKEPYLGPLPGNQSFPTPGPAFMPSSGDAAAIAAPTTAAPPARASQPTTSAQPTPAEAAATLRARQGKGPTMLTLDAQPAPTPVPTAPATADDTAPPANLEMPFAQDWSYEPPIEPHVRPLTKDEQRQADKAREQERKAEERRRREAEKAAERAAKQAQENAKKQS